MKKQFLEEIESITTTDNFKQVWASIPKQKSPEFHCYSCGILIEGTIYTDNSGIEMVHGGGVQCKICYLKSGHWQCLCNEERMLLDSMNFCHQCGKAKSQE